MPYTGLANFPETTRVIWNTRVDLDIPEATGDPTFVRSITVVPPAFSFASLEKLLQRTDKQLDRAARDMGGNVVPHQWGIIRGDEEPYRPIRHLFGTGYYLVAEVSRIVPATQPEDFDSRIDRGLRRFRERTTLRRKLNDMNESQFMYGYDANSVNQTPGIYLVDIEPLYREQVI